MGLLLGKHVPDWGVHSCEVVVQKMAELAHAMAKAEVWDPLDIENRDAKWWLPVVKHGACMPMQHNGCGVDVASAKQYNWRRALELEEQRPWPQGVPQPDLCPANEAPKTLSTCATTL